MKNITLSFFLLFVSFSAFSQVTSEPAEYTDPSTELKLIVNLDQLDATLDYVANLLSDADAGMDLYFWTWSPYEYPIGTPLANGEGAQPWKSSNELLKMTMEAPHIYSFTMIPTEFYNVPAATVYANDIKFLIKPKDGGGYGDPDRKSTDLTFLVDPPNVEKTLVYAFPSQIQQDDFFILTYDNYRDPKATLQNLGANDVAVYLEAKLSDSSSVVPSTIFTAGTNPNLYMTSPSAGVFEKMFIPKMFFNVPDGLKIVRIKAVVIKRSYFGAGADRVDSDFIISLKCD